MSSHANAFAPPEISEVGAPKDLFGLSRQDLQAELAALGEKPFRAKQLWHWIYHRGVRDFAEMTNLAKDFRQRLGDLYVIGRPKIVTAQVSADGTRKWLLGLSDGQEIECVFIPEEDRGTLCVSSQVGCTLTCKFCHTGSRSCALREVIALFPVQSSLPPRCQPYQTTVAKFSLCR